MARNPKSVSSPSHLGNRRRARRVAVAFVLAALATWAAVLVARPGEGDQPTAATDASITATTATDGSGRSPTGSDLSGSPAGEPEGPEPGGDPEADPGPEADPDPDPDPEPDPDADPEPDPDPDPDPDPQVPQGGNGDLAPAPTSPPPTCDGGCVAPVDLTPLSQDVGDPAANVAIAGTETAGCSIHCITRAQAFTHDDGTTDVTVEVVTRTPATIEVYIHTSAPQLTSAGRPYFPGVSAADHTVGDLDEFFSTTLTGLEEEWTYWIIISATDEDGRREYVTGNITTPRIDDDVVVAFAAIDVIYDGDKGRNKGELTFDWNLGTEEVGRNGEYHRGDGSRIDLDGQDSSRVLFDVEGVLPVLQVRGLETDPRGGLEFCSAGPDQGGYGTDEDCGYAWNSTLPFEPTIDDISHMSDCDVFDIGELYDGYRCTRIATTASHSGIPEFSVVVAFKVF